MIISKMKKLRLIKIILCVFIVFSTILSFNVKSYAINSNYYSNQIYVADTYTFYADSSQWKQVGDGWMCGTDEQPYRNAWIYTNGKWYFLNTSCYMVTNCWVNDWYVGADGSWIPQAKK